jgi:tRNA(Ile)-lysidine synthase
MTDVQDHTHLPSGPGDPRYHPLVRRVARGLRSRCRVPAGARLLVAVSGGADSVALLRALALLADRRRFKLSLTVAHVNHHLRGERSDGDALFVRTLASQLKLPCHITGVDLQGTPGNLEAAARRARYDALATLARESGTRYIATAHHADDQLETLLMRFIRGAGVRGLRGIAARRRLRHDDSSLKLAVVRPMLAVERADAVGFLNTLGQHWREDETNADTSLVRNRLRHEVIPLLKAIRADAPRRAVALGEHMGEMNRLLNEQAREALAEAEAEAGSAGADGTEPDGNRIDRAQARAMNPMVLTQMLRRSLMQAGVGGDQLPGHALHGVIEAVRDEAGGVRSFDFAGGAKVQVTKSQVCVVPPGASDAAGSA